MCLVPPPSRLHNQICIIACIHLFVWLSVQLQERFGLAWLGLVGSLVACPYEEHRTLPGLTQPPIPCNSCYSIVATTSKHDPPPTCTCACEHALDCIGTIWYMYAPAHAVMPELLLVCHVHTCKYVLAAADSIGFSVRLCPCMRIARTTNDNEELLIPPDQRQGGLGLVAFAGPHQRTLDQSPYNVLFCSIGGRRCPGF